MKTEKVKCVGSNCNCEDRDCWIETKNNGEKIVHCDRSKDKCC